MQTIGNTVMSAVAKVCKAFREVPIEVGRFLNAQYPSFLTARSPRKDADSVPVFMFHRVLPEPFKAQIRFLQENGYRTLSLTDFIRFLEGTFRPEAPSVLLTFDDGDQSWYDTAHPLLRDAGMKAAGFLVTRFIQDAAGSGPWLSWPQVLEMEASGVFEFASHTHSHDRVFVSDRLIGFMHPGFDKNPLHLDTPWYQNPDGSRAEIPPGAPVYAHTARTNTGRVFMDCPEIRTQCADWVQQQGGNEFFADPQWRKALREHHRSLCRGRTPGIYSEPAQAMEWLVDDLKTARKILDTKLGRCPDSLCFPWGDGSGFAVEAARTAGHRQCFWVCTRRSLNRSGDDPLYIPRMKDDYLQRLPGDSREPLTGIMMNKIIRRKQAEHLY